MQLQKQTKLEIYFYYFVCPNRSTRLALVKNIHRKPYRRRLNNSNIIEPRYILLQGLLSKKSRENFNIYKVKYTKTSCRS